MAQQAYNPRDPQLFTREVQRHKAFGFAMHNNAGLKALGRDVSPGDEAPGFRIFQDLAAASKSGKRGGVQRSVKAAVRNPHMKLGAIFARNGAVFFNEALGGVDGYYETHTPSFVGLVAVVTTAQSETGKLVTPYEVQFRQFAATASEQIGQLALGFAENMVAPGNAHEVVPLQAFKQHPTGSAIPPHISKLYLQNFA